MKDVVAFFKGISGIRNVYLFGSRAKGNERQDSDYDLCVVINKHADREYIYSLVGSFNYRHKKFLQILLMDEDEFIEKMKIPIYYEEIINNGKKLI